MENNLINNTENIPEEQTSVESDKKNKTVNGIIKLLMSSGVIAAFACYIYALFWFMNNSGV